MNLDCFKAYDIRGKVPTALSADLARQIGFAFAKEFNTKKVVIGYDARLSSLEIYQGLARGLQNAGVDVIGIGLCGTEEIYHAVAFTENNSFDGGIMVTGSHNPKDENGLKMVRKGAIPISSESGLLAIKDRILKGQNITEELPGSFEEKNYRDQYIQKLLSYIDISELNKFKIVADAGNGCAGPIIKAFAKHLPFEFIMLYEEPDGNFPHGVPNPILPENRTRTSKAILEHNADFGIAFDGDFDRCFFYDAKGNFIEGYYLVGMIASALLKNNFGQKIIHDPRLIWNTMELVNMAGGFCVESKSGHAFIKEKMRSEDAIYGGEMSAHHYFKDFAYCDSGMLPWLLVAMLLSQHKMSLADMVNKRIETFPCSGEINFKVKDVTTVLAKIEEIFAKDSLKISHLDGLTMEFENFRFNVRGSNTEPVLRLNVESRANKKLLEEKTNLLTKIITE